MSEEGNDMPNAKTRISGPLCDVTNSDSHSTPASKTSRKLGSTKKMIVNAVREIRRGIFPSYVYRNTVECLDLENMMGTPFLSEGDESEEINEERNEESGESIRSDQHHFPRHDIAPDIQLLAEQDFARLSLGLSDSPDVCDEVIENNTMDARRTILRGVPKPAGNHIRFDD